MIEHDDKRGFGGALNRRSLLTKAGTGAAGTLALGAMGIGGAVATSTPAAAATYTDADILTFALNLEYLEAEYYLRGVLGTGLPTVLNGNGAGVVAPSDTVVPFKTPALAYYFQNLASDEQAHVSFLRTALAAEGATVVAAPRIDLMNSFTTLAVAAGLITSGQTFNPFADELSFLIGAYIFEDVGVTAYAGAANALTNPNNLTAAASILAIEGYHAGAIRGFLAQIGGGTTTNAVSALRAKLSGSMDSGTSITGNPFSFNNVDSNAQVIRRTPQQVLNIVYGTGSTGQTSGLFFPDGVNGSIQST